MTALKELYDTVTRLNGWSMRDVERRAESKGRPISKSRIGQLINSNPLEGVNATMILALAAGLNVSPARVAVAAVQSMGFAVDGGDITPAEAIARDETISEDTKTALLAILHSPRRGVKGA